MAERLKILVRAYDYAAAVFVVLIILVTVSAFVLMRYATKGLGSGDN